MTEETKYPKPTEEQIKETIALIEKKLASPAMEKQANAQIKVGYRRARKLLIDRQTTYDGIETLPYVRSRAIAELAVDYLNGEESQKMLTGIPI